MLLFTTNALFGQQDPDRLNYDDTHFIEVCKYRQWGKDFLTVANNWDGLLSEVEEGELPICLDVITEVNGVSTENMTTRRFYQIADKASQLSLTYKHKENGTTTTKTCVLSPKKDYYLYGGISVLEPIQRPNTINIVADTDIDFFKYNTFDYKIEGDDPLTDKSIMVELSNVYIDLGLKRDTDNPDLIFLIKKKLDQTSNSTYIPKTTHTINTGSTSQLKKNYITGKNYVETQQHYQTYTTGGYTHTDINASFHLTFTIMDGEKWRSNPESLPVVWQLDYKQFAKNTIDMMDIVKTDIYHWCSNYPFTNGTFSYNISTTGIVFKDHESIRTGEIVDVLKGSAAYELGLRGGDKILRATKGEFTCLSGVIGERHFFKANSSQKAFRKLGWVGYFCPLVPCYIQRTNNRPYTYLSNAPGENNKLCYPMTPKYRYYIQSKNGEERVLMIRKSPKDAFKESYIRNKCIPLQ